MKKILTFLTLSTFLLASCSSTSNLLKYDDELLYDGIYENIATEPDEYGFYAYVSLMVFDGEINTIYCDGLSPDGDSKYYLSTHDLYPMNAENIAPWHEQIELLNDFVFKNQSVMTGEFTDGKVDVISGCTIAVEPHVELISSILTDPESHFKNIKTDQDVFADGDYSLTSETTDSDGFFPTATVTFKDEYLVGVFLDSLNADGTSKRQISIEQNTDWHSQIDAYSDYILDLQFVPNTDFNDDGTVNEPKNVTIPVVEHATLVSNLLNRTT